MIELFLVLVHREVLVPEAAAKVPDAPSALAIARDIDIPSTGQNLLVKGIGDDFSNSMESVPVFEHAVDVKVKFFYLSSISPCYLNENIYRQQLLER